MTKFKAYNFTIYVTKSIKRHEFSTGLMLGTIWNHKSFETQKLLWFVGRYRTIGFTVPGNKSPGNKSPKGKKAHLGTKVRRTKVQEQKSGEQKSFSRSNRFPKIGDESDIRHWICNLGEKIFPLMKYLRENNYSYY